MRLRGGEEIQQLFEDAVSTILDRWTALSLAITNGWGGQEGESRKNELHKYICKKFVEEQEIDADELMQELNEFLLEQFHTDAQDDSCAQVAAHITLLATQLREGVVDEALRLTRMAATSNLRACKEVQEEEHMETCSSKFWDELGSETRAAWEELGWDEPAWNGDAEEPPSARRRWCQLSPLEQTAATRLGFDEKSWDEDKDGAD